MDDDVSKTQSPEVKSSGSSKTMLIVGGIVLLVLAAAGVIFAQKSAKTSAPTPESVAVVENTVEPQVITASDVREIAIQGKDFSFSPSSFTLKKGEKVRVVFKNVGTKPHAFVIEGLDVKTNAVSPGQTESVDFTAPAKATTLTYFCNIGTHRELGMVGKITVE